MIVRSRPTFGLGLFWERQKLRARRLSSYGLTVFVILLSVSLIRTAAKVVSAYHKLDDARQKVEKLSRENTKLREELSQASSDISLEKNIRDKLGLAKPGESVVVLPDPDVLGRLYPTGEMSGEDSLPKPNWEKWLDLFL